MKRFIVIDANTHEWVFESEDLWHAAMSLNEERPNRHCVLVVVLDECEGGSGLPHILGEV